MEFIIGLFEMKSNNITRKLLVATCFDHGERSVQGAGFNRADKGLMSDTFISRAEKYLRPYLAHRW
jgi:hypothetical protein